MHSLVIKPFAALDATDAFDWYTDKREGLGDEFHPDKNSTKKATRMNLTTSHGYDTCGSFIYEDGLLRSILTPEGRDSLYCLPVLK